MLQHLVPVLTSLSPFPCSGLLRKKPAGFSVSPIHLSHVKGVLSCGSSPMFYTCEVLCFISTQICVSVDWQLLCRNFYQIKHPDYNQDDSAKQSSNQCWETGKPTPALPEWTLWDQMLVQGLVDWYPSNKAEKEMLYLERNKTQAPGQQWITRTAEQSFSKPLAALAINWGMVEAWGILGPWQEISCFVPLRSCWYQIIFFHSDTVQSKGRFFGMLLHGQTGRKFPWKQPIEKVISVQAVSIKSLHN